MCTNQQHRQTLSFRPESKLFPKFILETSLTGSPENFRIILPAKPGLFDIINLNLSNSCPVELDHLINVDFIVPQLKYLADILKAYVELKNQNQYISAYIIFRSYIEISTQFYACLLDFDFYKKYTTNSIDEEYRKHWFKHLKPSKVLETLKKMNYNFQAECKNGGKYSADLRGIIYPFESDLRDELYELLSSFSHGKLDSILYEFNQVESNSLDWRISEFLINSFSLLNISTMIYLSEKNKLNSRKHLILQQVWHSINYDN